MRITGKTVMTKVLLDLQVINHKCLHCVVPVNSLNSTRQVCSSESVQRCASEQDDMCACAILLKQTDLNHTFHMPNFVKYCCEKSSCVCNGFAHKH